MGGSSYMNRGGGGGPPQFDLEHSHKTLSLINYSQGGKMGGSSYMNRGGGGGPPQFDFGNKLMSPIRRSL